MLYRKLNYSDKKAVQAQFVNKKKLKIMIVVGEASGDAHGASLVKALRKLAPEIEFEFFGTTGSKMRESGVETIYEADEFGIIGALEVAKALPMFWGVYKDLKKVADERQPDLVVSIDFPDFNLKFARAMKKRGFKVVYFISPQLWAWRTYRINIIKNYVDLLLSILPFEKDWYAERGIHHVEFVGNPLVSETIPKISKDKFCDKHDLDSSKPTVALLPGSRRKEIERILPVLIKTASLMAVDNPNLQFVIPLASNRSKSEVKKILSDCENVGVEIPKKLIVVQNETFEAINAADVVAVASGTATLETALIGTPLVVVYKSTNLNYRLIKPLVSVEHYSLVNLIARRKLVKELIQHEFTPEILSKELFRLLKEEFNTKMRTQLKELKKSLGDGDAAKVVAEKILDLLKID